MSKIMFEEKTIVFKERMVTMVYHCGDCGKMFELNRLEFPANEELTFIWPEMPRYCPFCGKINEYLV